MFLKWKKNELIIYYSKLFFELKDKMFLGPFKKKTNVNFAKNSDFWNDTH